MRENDGSAFALVDIGHSPAIDFQELLSSERLCALGHCFSPLEHSESCAFQTAQAPPPDRLPGAACSYPQFASPPPGAPIPLCPWCRKKHSLASGRDDSAYPAPPLPAPGSPCAARPFERTRLPVLRILPPGVPHPALPESRRYTPSCFPLTNRKSSRTVRCRSSALTQSPYRPAVFSKCACRPCRRSPRSLGFSTVP